MVPSFQIAFEIDTAIIYNAGWEIIMDWLDYRITNQ
jgi:hypothetical protein